MFDLLCSHFEGVTRPIFERDLSEKHWVIEVRNQGRLLGFTTLLCREMCVDGKDLIAIYSGDTIVAPEAWRRPSLARNWIQSVNYLRMSWPDAPCYWLLLTSGYRTYRFLPVFWREFFPRFNLPVPEDKRRLLNYLASVQYGANYDSESGLVRFPKPQRLIPNLRAVPQGREQDPDIAYFLQRNPGYSEGDELVCLTEIHEINMTAAGRRMILISPKEP